MAVNFKPTPLKVLISVMVAVILLLGVIKSQSCPEQEFLLCAQPATLHQPVWSCTFYCTTQVKNYFLYVLEMGVPFVVLFIISYLVFSSVQHRRKN